MESGLYLVTTPIGNAQDISLRALEVLKNCDIVYCEDTRNFKKLASILGISLSDKTINSFHDHSDENKVKSIIENAKSKICAYVSDAGSPLISDPALPLVKSAIENDIAINSIGGVSSVIVAMELSGLPSTPFHFHGFLARDNSKRAKDLDIIKSQYGTHVFFEGVSRVEKTLSLFCNELKEFDFVVARELTKEYESVYRFKGKDFSQVKDQITYKGEFVILIYNDQKSEISVGGKIQEIAFDIINSGAKPKLLSKLLSEITGENSKDIYKKLNTQK